MRILIADDEGTSRKLLGHVLGSWGYEVLPVCDGREAWEQMRAESPPPLAILDWMMPGLDGVEVCRLVRALVTSSPPYIILLTARSGKDDIVAGLTAGANDFLTKPFDREELHARVEVGRRFVELNQELLENREQLRVQALTDALTGILNRRAILQTLEEEIARTQAERDNIAVGMMDIDMFKSINDAFGHAAGDEVLREVVRRSADSLRSDDSFGRFGGEEFLLVLPGVDSEAARPILERVRNAVSSSAVQVGGRPVRVTVSIGGAVRDGESIDDLIRVADDALYAAKAAGRDRVVMSRAAITFPTVRARERKSA